MNGVKIINDWCRPNLRGYIIILICVLIEILIDCAGGIIYVRHADTSTYFDAAEIIMRGGIDESRTPIYPFLLGCFNLLTHSEHYTSIIMVIVQWLCFLISVFYMLKTLRLFNVPEKAIFWITLFYAVCPGINSHNYLIVTDSLALSFAVLYMYLCARAWFAPNMKHYMAVWTMVLIMIFLRPIFIYLLPVTIVFAVLLSRRERTPRMILVNIIGTVVNLMVIGAYVYSMNEKFGIKTISVVSSANNYHIVRSLHAKPGDDFGNQELINAVDSCYNTTPEIAFSPIFREWSELYVRFGGAEMTRFVNSALMNNRLGACCKVMGHFYKATDYPIFCSAVPSTLWDLFALNISFFYIVAVLWTVAIIREWMRNRKIPGVFSLCWMVYVCGLLVAMIGAPGEYGRLTLPCAAPLMIFVGWVCSHIKWHGHERDEHYHDDFGNAELER